MSSLLSLSVQGQTVNPIDDDVRGFITKALYDFLILYKIGLFKAIVVKLNR
jgi:hypothetical protein